MKKEILAGALLALAATGAWAQSACKHGADLDKQYCDDNGDLLADAPKDKSKLRNPSTLIFSYTPIEDPAVYANLFKPLLDHLGQCTGKRVVNYMVQSNAAQVEAMRAGRLHVTGYASGQVGFAVNLAGAVPFAIKGNESGPRNYHLAMVVKASSPYQKLSDLKGKKIAHTSPSSNSGNLAPRALFPGEGLAPDKDYKVLYSGKHDQSLMGVLQGDYDAAPITSDVLERFISRGVVKANDVRVIYKSGQFPTSAFALTHDLEPALATKIQQCFFSFRFTPEMKKEFLGDDRFLPVDYKRDWDLVRKVAVAAGTPYNLAQFQKENTPAPKK